MTSAKELNVGYCVRCGKKVIMQNPKGKVFRVRGGNRFAVQGACPYCRTKVTRFLSQRY